MKIYVRVKGGPGSGFRNHRGRPGARGGSSADMYPVSFNPLTVAIFNDIRAAGGKPYLVGGYPRDLVRGKQPKDLDTEVHGLPLNKLQTILEKHASVNAVGKSFGILKVDMRKDGGDELDFSVPRTENKVGVGHTGFAVTTNPNMSMRESASRRDFTMNSMLLGVDGKLYDPYNGKADLEARILRHVSPKFAEDPLRVLRGVQFAARDNMTMAAETVELSRSLSPEYSSLAKDRVWGEFDKLGKKGDYAGAGLQILQDTGWVEHFPGLRDMDAATFNAAKTSATNAAQAAKRDGLSLDQRSHEVFAATLSHTTPEKARAFLKEVGAPNDVVNGVMPIVENARNLPKTASVGYTRRLSNTLGEKVSVNSFTRVLDAMGHKDLAGNIRSVAEREGILHSPVKAYVQGRDLLARGVKPGKQMGVILAQLFNMQLDGASPIEVNIKLNELLGG